MKTGLLIISIMLLSACTTGYDPDIKQEFFTIFKSSDSDAVPPKNELNHLTQKLVAEMLSNNQFVTKQNAIAVTSIVDLKGLSQTNRLSHQLSEGIVHNLHDSGFRVVDFKLTGTIAVTETGDFIHSRDWEELSLQHPIDYLVSGTLDEYDSGVYLSVRMIGAKTQVVVGSAQAFVSQAMLERFTKPPEKELTDQEAELAQTAMRIEQEHQEKLLQQQMEKQQRKSKMDNGYIFRKE